MFDTGIDMYRLNGNGDVYLKVQSGGHSFYINYNEIFSYNERITAKGKLFFMD